MKGYAIHAGEAGTAIISYERGGDGRIDVLELERLGTGLDHAVTWMERAFPHLPDIGDAQIIIDSEGIGRALWDKFHPRGHRGWRLYAAYGRDRQALVNALLVAMSERRIHIGGSVHEPALRKALGAYKRIVADDGVIGGELVVALALAAFAKPKPALFVGAT